MDTTQTERKTYFMLGCELQGVDHPQNLVKIATCTRWVQNGQLEVSLRIHDKDSATRHRYPSAIDAIRINHPKANSELEERGEGDMSRPPCGPVKTQRRLEWIGCPQSLEQHASACLAAGQPPVILPHVAGPTE